jgi:WD40 repeat protein
MRTLAVSMALAGALAAEPAQVATIATPARPYSFFVAKSGGVAGAVCADRKLHLWALPDGREITAIELGRTYADAVALSTDGSVVAVGDHSGSYTVWDVKSGSQLLHLQMPFYPSALALSPDGKRLAIAPANEGVQIFDISSGRKLVELPRPVGGSQDINFSRDGRLLVTADADTVVRVYNTHDGELLSRYTDFLMEPLAATFTADGKRVLTGGGDKVVALLDASNGRAVRSTAKLVDPVAYLDVSPDGAYFATGLLHADNMGLPAPVIISEVASGRDLQSWTPPVRPVGGGWTEDGHLLAATATPTSLVLWRVW